MNRGKYVSLTPKPPNGLLLTHTGTAPFLLKPAGGDVNQASALLEDLPLARGVRCSVKAVKAGRCYVTPASQLSVCRFRLGLQATHPPTWPSLTSLVGYSGLPVDSCGGYDSESGMAGQCITQSF